jgi:hypothetical protein
VLRADAARDVTPVTAVFGNYTLLDTFSSLFDISANAM